jgi:hypothetical protein
MQKRIEVRVNSFAGPHIVWNCHGYIREQDSEAIYVECFLDDVEPINISTRLFSTSASLPDSVFVPQSPQRVQSPPPAPFRAIVHDTQSWGPTDETQQQLIASDSEEEREETPVIPVVPIKKRGRPKGSKNRIKGDEAWRKKAKGPKECSAKVWLENINQGIECTCCTVDSQLLVKCRNCDVHLCMVCIGKVERRFEGKCPYCTLIF